MIFFFNECFSCLLSPITYLYVPKSTKCSLCITLNVKQTTFISVLFNVSVAVKVNPKGRGDTDVQKNKIRGMQSKQHIHLHHKCTVLSMFVTDFIKLRFDKQDWDKVFPKEGIEIAVSVHSTELFDFIGWQWNDVKYSWDAANKSVKTFRWNTT